MKAVELKPGVYWVGAKDWHMREFHGYKTQRGTTYNAYLIVDEKITLIDTVKAPFANEMLTRIASIVDPARIDIVVSNHVEMDHSGALPDVLRLAHRAELITSPAGEQGLKQHYPNEPWNYKAVKTGTSINIGKRNLSFVQVPFVHWPDSMVTWLAEDKILFSNDAFGQHIAPLSLFDDEMPRCILFEEAAKYYANIVYPFAAQVEKALDAVRPLGPDIIAPAHGVMWRKDVTDILGAYTKWVKAENDGSALIVYDSMWNSTERMAQVIRGFFEQKGVPVKFMNLKVDHISDIMTSVLTAKYVAIGTPVLNGGMMPSMAALLCYIKGLKPRGKIGFVFGSYGWDNKVYKEIEETLKQLEWTLPSPAVAAKWIPKEADLDKLEATLEAVLQAGG